MKNLKVLVGLLVFAFVFQGCTQRIGDFTLISTKNVEIGGKYKMVKRAEGEDKTFMFFFPFGMPNLKTAVDRCIENGAGDLLTNSVINFTNPILIGPFGYGVTGDVWAKATVGDLMNGDIELYDLRAGVHGLELISLKDQAKHIDVAYIGR